ncbi:MAG: ABC transporter substrate-binding protein [candidate division NC10 bacterium]|uniref:ABC transporter substrate-binding protein n=1 Tax=Tectimicrobiota bacterium TaxID=2528274 RepID=A0A932HW31_UNCTE|nr:ABC transporter substrate-binding protein [candidate division NC10 bacterium]MBI3126586.1 ABC transporter substrate-binding protein [Candidatus Tectomicrobia bacterium]
MADLELTGAFGDYDRTHYLTKGLVKPEGIALRVVEMPPTEIFHRMCNYLEFDCSEMSMGAHCFLLGAGESPFVGMPAFPSRAFRHSMAYANTGAKVEKVPDLNGKRVAIREWGMTAVVWIVGILSEEYGLDMKSVEWVAALKPRVPIQMPKGMKLTYMKPGQNLSDMLDSGEVDGALYHQVPACFAKGSSRVKRLFPDYKAAEVEYYRRSGIHPPMHCVVVRKEIAKREPWVVRSLYKAMCEARRRAMEALSDSGAYSAMVPFLPSAVEETRALFGENYWPYGLEANRKTLEKLVLYAHQQGLTPRLLEVEELFGESVREG